jgi:hypothetical protein
MLSACCMFSNDENLSSNKSFCKPLLSDLTIALYSTSNILCVMSLKISHCNRKWDALLFEYSEEFIGLVSDDRTDTFSLWRHHQITSICLIVVFD